MIVAKNGRYGPYVSHDGVNANLPSDKTPETITLDEAVVPDRRPRRAVRRQAFRAPQAPGPRQAPKKAPAPKTPGSARSGGKGARGQQPKAAAKPKPKKRAAASAAKAPPQIEEGREGRGGRVAAVQRPRWQSGRAAPTFKVPERAERARPLRHPGNSLVRTPPKSIPFPSKDEILAFINEQPGKVGTREIARAFNLKNDSRVELKRMLRELADEGRVECRRKKLHQAGGLPAVTLADVTGRDSDGELLATPTEWDEDEHGPVPKIRIATPRKRAAARGGRRRRPRAAARRRKPTMTTTSATPAASSRSSTRPRRARIGIFRALPGGGGRLVPVDKKQLGQELVDPARAPRKTRRTAT